MSDHIVALHNRLMNEKRRLESATTQGEIDLRTVWIAQIEKEIDGELAFLEKYANPEMTDDELLAELMA